MQEVAFGWNYEEVRRWQLLTSESPPLGADVDRDRYAWMREELPNLVVHRKSFWITLSDALFKFLESSVVNAMTTKNASRVKQRTAAWFQTLQMSLSHLSRQSVDQYQQLLTAQPTASCPSLLHRLFGQIRYFDISAFSELILTSFPIDELKRLATVVDDRGRTPLLVLVSSALSAPLAANPSSHHFDLPTLKKLSVGRDLPLDNALPAAVEPLDVSPYAPTTASVVAILQLFIKHTSASIDQAIQARTYDHSTLRKRIRRGWKAPRSGA